MCSVTAVVLGTGKVDSVRTLLEKGTPLVGRTLDEGALPAHQVLETPILYEVDDEADCSPECEYQRQSSQQGSCPSALVEEGCKKVSSSCHLHS